jgi:hypothetical protein
MNELYVSEEYICIDGEKRFSGGGGDDPYLTRYTTTGDLYRACVKQYGKCLGKMYVGEDKPQQVGWIFFRKATNKDEYDQEVWITVFKKLPIKRVSWEVEYPTFKKQRSRSHESSH